MASLRFLFGMIPATSKFEAGADKLRADYQEYKKFEVSDELKHFQELETEVNSAQFKQKQKSTKSKEFKETEEYKKLQEYLGLVKSEKIVWYTKIKKKYPFAPIERWDLSFEENFSSGKVDPKTWMNRYLQGDKILNKSYVFADDKHAFTEGKNLEVNDKKLRILTKREKAKGLVWHPKLGFFEKEFDFSSDMISSANSFSQSYGMIEAKIKFGRSGVSQAFSLMSGQILPHVDVVKYEKGKIFSGNFWKNGSGVSKSLTSAGGGKYSGDYHIYTLIWEAGKLTWKVNGVVFKTQTSGVPDMAMFMVFNSSLKEKAKEDGIPSAFEIDWVRVYKAK